MTWEERQWQQREDREEDNTKNRLSVWLQIYVINICMKRHGKNKIERREVHGAKNGGVSNNSQFVYEEHMRNLLM